MSNEKVPFSIVYQITQECPYRCPICLRRYVRGEKVLDPGERRRMVALLKSFGLKRLTITGGEPTILGDELFDFMKYVHQYRIHTCLSSTGHQLSEQRIYDMDAFLDQFLISIRSLRKTEWIKDFGDTRFTLELLDTVINILRWIKQTGIIVEVNTVIHKENLESVIELGWQLLDINPNVIWRLDEYYPTGIEVAQRPRFEVTSDEFQAIRETVIGTFSHLFRRIRFSEKELRIQSPEYLVTHTGELVTTSNFVHTPTGYNLNTGPIPETFKNLHSWSLHRLTCREWGWAEGQLMP